MKSEGSAGLIEGGGGGVYGERSKKEKTKEDINETVKENVEWKGTNVTLHHDMSRNVPSLLLQ